MSTPETPRENSLRYAILGEDTRGLEEKLDGYRGRVDWKYLRPHFQMGALLYVDPELDLAEVGAAFAQDDKVRVEAWLKARDVVKIEAMHAAQWEIEPAEFEALVVSPFVLCRLA